MLWLWTLCPFNAPLTQSVTQFLTPLMALGNRQLKVLITSVLSYSTCVGVTFLNLSDVFSHDHVEDLVYAIDLEFFCFYAYNLKIWSLHGVLHIPFMHAYVCLCFNVFFSYFLLEWSNSSTLFKSPGILSCACFLLLLRLLQSFLVGLLTFPIPFSSHMGFLFLYFYLFTKFSFYILSCPLHFRHLLVFSWRHLLLISWSLLSC